MEAGQFVRVYAYVGGRVGVGWGDVCVGVDAFLNLVNECIYRPL